MNPTREGSIGRGPAGNLVAADWFSGKGPLRCPGEFPGRDKRIDMTRAWPPGFAKRKSCGAGDRGPPTLMQRAQVCRSGLRGKPGEHVFGYEACHAASVVGDEQIMLQAGQMLDT